jgi:hypothetical protein
VTVEQVVGTLVLDKDGGERPYKMMDLRWGLGCECGRRWGWVALGVGFCFVVLTRSAVLRLEKREAHACVRCFRNKVLRLLRRVRSVCVLCFWKGCC